MIEQVFLETFNKNPELTYVGLLILLFIVPRLFLSWGLPTAITSMLLGFCLGATTEFLHHDPGIPFFAGLGIVSLFLIAGLEVDLEALRRKSSVLWLNLLLRALVVAGVGFAAMGLLDLSWRAAVLLALALLTPSAGFILDSLPKLGLAKDEQDWVKAKAISAELLALAALFIVMNSSDLISLILATLALAGMVWLLPLAFRSFARLLPAASVQTEFIFLLIVALTCATFTRLLGAYYLVGAFVVGMVTRAVHLRAPERFGHRVIDALDIFAAFFITFYFFKAGLHVSVEDLSAPALAAGAAFLIVVLPLRVLVTFLQRRAQLGETKARSFRIAVPLLPTLVFTLVIAEILKNQFQIPDWLFGGLIIYAVLNTLVPAVVFKVPSNFAEPELANNSD